MANSLTTEIKNGVQIVTHPTGVIAEHTIADYDNLIELTQHNADESKKELLALQGVRQKMIDTQGV